MKRVTLFFSFIFIFFSVFSSEVKEKKMAAQEHYAQGKYEEAIADYTSMLSNENESPELFYNIGNAYYKNGEVGKAILYYERALLISPNFDDAKYNLEIAQLKTIDKIDEVERFFFTRWIDNTVNLMDSNSWAWVSLSLFVLFILLLLVYLFFKQEIIKKGSFYIGIFLLLFSILSLSFAYKQKQKVEKREYTIIMEATTTIKSSPDHSGTDLFVLHEGTKVKIKSVLGEWVEVQLADGNIGWIKETSIEKI